MTIIQFIMVFGFWIFSVLATYSSGLFLIKHLINNNNLGKALETGIAILLGIGVFGNASLFIGLYGAFTRQNLILILVIMLFLGIKTLLTNIKLLVKLSLVELLRLIKDPIAVIAVFLVIITSGSLYLAAMAPPVSSDELHYHFPQARDIVNSHSIDLKFGGHYFYGNIPKFMEIVFASGLSLNGYSLAHAYNYLVLISFILVIYGFVNKLTNIRSALFAALLVLWYDHFTWNATVGFIDSATVAYELTALLVILLPSKTLNFRTIMLAGLLSGTAFSIKYSPAPTYLFILFYLIIGFLFIKQSSVKNVLIGITIFGISTAITCGFWYGKNLIIYGNPFFPLYFGHFGVSEQIYNNLMAAIQQFEPKTFKSFWKLLGPYRSITQGTVLLSLFIAPFTILISKSRKYVFILLSYILLYINYWFFLGTHQVRFLGPAFVVAQILGAIVLAKINSKILISLILTAFFFTSIYLHIPLGSLWKEFWSTRLHITERQYALGNITEREFLHRAFGCQYDVITYLEDNRLEGKIIDNWSAWHAPSVGYYAKNNIIGEYPAGSVRGETVREKALVNNYKYLYYSEKVKSAHLVDPDPMIRNRKIDLLRGEEEILLNANLIYQNGDCKLFAL